MKVLIIGQTEPRLEQDFHLPGKADGSAFQYRYWDDDYMNGQELVEFAGRLCYESFDLPNPKTAENGPYVQNIVALGHESVLEHVSVTFYVEGVSRNLSHELIRHRHLSFSELSQRYVDMNDANMVLPPAVREDDNDILQPTEGTVYLDDYNNVVEHITGDGGTKKQAREAARFYLPSAMETKFVVTGNLRAWRDVLKKRDSPHADAEMQLLAKEIKRLLTLDYPDVFKDLNEDRSGEETA